MSRIRLCKAGDVPPQGMKCYDGSDGQKVLVLRSVDGFRAFQGLCPHQDVCLDEGFFDGRTLTCHQHLWQWDASTGEAMGLAEAPLERYALEQVDDELFLVRGSALRASQLFKDVAEPTLHALEALARRECHASPDVIYDVGDPATDIYVLESGRVEFVVGREDRTRRAGFMLRKGEAFGWAALLDDHPVRIARATCMEPSQVLRLDGRHTLELLRSDPVSGFEVMRQLSHLIAYQLTSAAGR
ncbi:cyclic nucleotide-binding domain-containing protein [uncultured Azohydromonas sp.]|jgi:Ferredoxin subunits of nitrite reductase and ring-hydroxylating dioxygenases|uniref:cyclic nucleotide-binding domain-containing protein n=1 Tax=uncultured Azohydromonas sp. TaxID=487342 RepID=UPI002611B17F|nr:cyclic nucleotide-binding domain-containing protein [uncultured Azohydromonas sp.]